MSNKVDVACLYCNGSGSIAFGGMPGTQPCGNCGGSGRITDSAQLAAMLGHVQDNVGGAGFDERKRAEKFISDAKKALGLP